MIVTTDSVLQGDFLVCGRICLYAIKRHWDSTISYEAVLQSIEAPFYSGTTKELVWIAQKFNLNANVYKISVKTLFALPPPFIIH
jgi:ABC-type bacteriocin/lantibiotic exporter with double-glycine peptidase domain